MTDKQDDKQDKPFAALLETVKDRAIGVITGPEAFYKEMPKTGGFLDPLLFAVAMGVVTGLVQAVLALVGLNPFASAMMAVFAVVFVPIVVGIIGFISAAVLFIIWKIMGSEEPYETAYRCGAFSMAVLPLTAVMGLIPYVGSVLGIAWVTYLLIVASIQVQKLKVQNARVVFGILGCVLALISVTSEFAGRQDSPYEKAAEDLKGNAADFVNEMRKKFEEGEEK